MASKGYLAQMRGFTLIEISIVLVVIGLLLSGGLVALGPVLQNAKRTTTENTLTKIEDALLLYAIQNNCLPCPADAVVAGAQTEGQQQNNTPANIATACAGTAACFTNAQSVVPWLTLGLSKSEVTDEWGTLITYHVSTNTLAAGCDNLQDGTNDANSDGFRRHNGTTPPTFPVSCLDIEDANLASFNSISTAAAYVLISHGEDTSGGFASESGAARSNNQAAGNDAQLENNDGSCDSTGTPCHQDAAIDFSNNTYFDDIVRWKTAPVLVFQCGDGACGNP